LWPTSLAAKLLGFKESFLTINFLLLGVKTTSFVVWVHAIPGHCTRTYE